MPAGILKSLLFHFLGMASQKFTLVYSLSLLLNFLSRLLGQPIWCIFSSLKARVASILEHTKKNMSLKCFQGEIIIERLDFCFLLHQCLFFQVLYLKSKGISTYLHSYHFLQIWTQDREHLMSKDIANFKPTLSQSFLSANIPSFANSYNIATILSRGSFHK